MPDSDVCPRRYNGCATVTYMAGDVVRGRVPRRADTTIGITEEVVDRLYEEKDRQDTYDDVLRDLLGMDPYEEPEDDSDATESAENATEKAA